MKSFKRPSWLLPLTTIALWLFSVAVPAQTTIEVMSGKDGTRSTYLQVFEEFADACKETQGFPKITRGTTTGSNASFQALLENQVPVIVAQGDVAHWLKRTSSYNMDSVRQLFALHTEPVLFVAKASTQVTWSATGRISAWWNKTDTTLRLVEQLDGATVGAVDGSGAYTTARLIRDAGALPYVVNSSFGNFDAMKAALDKGDIKAMVLVGAALPAVKALGKEYRLLSLTDQSRTKLSEVNYAPAAPQYSNLAEGGQAKTVSTRAAVFVWNYGSPKWAAAFTAMRDCMRKSLEDIQETPKTSPAWRDVKLDANVWPVWEPRSK